MYISRSAFRRKCSGSVADSVLNLETPACMAHLALTTSCFPSLPLSPSRLRRWILILGIVLVVDARKRSARGAQEESKQRS